MLAKRRHVSNNINMSTVFSVTFYDLTHRWHLLNKRFKPQSSAPMFHRAEPSACCPRPLVRRSLNIVRISSLMIRLNNSLQHNTFVVCCPLVKLAFLITIFSRTTNTYCHSSFILERSPPIQEVIEAGVVPRFVQFLQLNDNPVCFFTPFHPISSRN